MNSKRLYDRMAQVIGLILLAAVTVALIYLFHSHLLPYQDAGDAFDTVYKYSENSSVSDSESSENDD